MNLIEHIGTNLLEFSGMRSFINDTNIPNLTLNNNELDIGVKSRLCDFRIENGCMKIMPVTPPRTEEIIINLQNEENSLVLLENKKYSFTLRFFSLEGEQYFFCFDNNYDETDSSIEIKELRMCVNSYVLWYQAEQLFNSGREDLLHLLDQFLMKTSDEIFDHRNHVGNFEGIIADIVQQTEKENFSTFEELDLFVHCADEEEIIYFDKYYIKLSKLIRQKTKISNDFEAIVLTWFLLKKMAIQHFHQWVLENTSIQIGMDFSYYKEQFNKLNFVEFSEEQLEMRLMYFLIKEGIVKEEDFYKNIDEIYGIPINTFESNQYSDIDEFEQFLLSNDLIKREEIKIVTIEEIDKMSGVEFENFLEQLFLNLGYRITLTKKSGDQGVDLILTKGNQKIGVQCKRSNTTIGNKAVQEICAGLNFYGLNRGMVVTNNIFTASAQNLALSNSIILWDRIKLLQQLELINL